jgi:uncharacterized protein (DUF58 family)
MRRTPHDEGHDKLTYGALLDAVRGLRWSARRSSRIAVPGIHPSRVRGSSAEFTEYRPYRQGDDLRRIDWKLFARSDRAHVRISEERAVTPTYLVMDASVSMAFPDGVGSKWALARQLAVALTSVAHSGGDPVGLMVAGNPRATIQPRTRRGIVTEVIRTLDGLAVTGSSPLAPTIALAARSAARIAIVSDLLGDLDDTLKIARELIAAGRDVHVIHVIANEEMEPSTDASFVTDPESAEIRRALGGDTREGYLRAFGAWRESTSAAWLASGAAYRVVVAGREAVSHAVRRIARDEPLSATADRLGKTR